MQTETKDAPIFDSSFTYFINSFTLSQLREKTYKKEKKQRKKLFITMETSFHLYFV